MTNYAKQLFFLKIQGESIAEQIKSEDETAYNKNS